MAVSKLTLSIDRDIIEKAKDYAKRKHTSVSKMFEEYLGKVAESENKDNDRLTEMIKNMVVPDDIQALTGILKGKYPDDYNFKDAKYEYLKEKYDL